jgi:hypothetical protein
MKSGLVFTTISAMSGAAILAQTCGTYRVIF